MYIFIILVKQVNIAQPDQLFLIDDFRCVGPRA